MLNVIATTANRIMAGKPVGMAVFVKGCPDEVLKGFTLLGYAQGGPESPGVPRRTQGSPAEPVSELPVPPLGRPKIDSKT